MSADFSKKFIEDRKAQLMKLREGLLNQMRVNSNEDLVHEPDQVVEEGDQAQAYLEQNLTFELRDKEIHKLREIEAALGRIDSGVYGYCEESEEPISQKRLEKVPWARCTIEVAEQMERSIGIRHVV